MLTVTQGSELFRKTYDGTTAYDGDALALLEVDGLRDGDDARSVLSATAVFAKASAGETSVTVALALREGYEDVYALESDALTGLSGVIDKIRLTKDNLMNLRAPNKTYDGTTSVPDRYTTGLVLSGLVNGESLSVSASAVYEDPGAGTGKRVYFTFSLSGSTAGNYELNNMTVTNGAIQKRAITVTYKGGAISRTYNGTASIKVSELPDDSLTQTAFASVDSGRISLSSSIEFNDKNVGTGKTVTGTFSLKAEDGYSSLLANYELRTTSLTFTNDGKILAKPLSRAYVGKPLERVYDKTRNVYRGDDSSLSENKLKGSDFDIRGIIEGDDVAWDNFNASFDSSDVGKRVAVIEFLLSGDDATNYSVENLSISGTITRKHIHAQDILYSPVGKQTFTGRPIQPPVTLVYDNESLTQNTDYTVIYSNNTQIGTATISINGINNYTGYFTETFSIAAQKAVALKLTRSAKKTVKMGACYQLKLSKKVKSYKSSNTSVAAVSKKGVVLAKKAGKAVITVTFTDKKTLKLTLTVVDPTMPTKLAFSTAVEETAGVMEGADLVLYTDGTGTARIRPVMSPSTAVSELTWTASSDLIMTLSPSSDGGWVVTATGQAGTATITGTTARGGRTATLRVTALDSFEARKVTIGQGAAAKAYLNVDEPEFTAVITAFNGHETEGARWTSSNPAVAAIDPQSGRTTLLKAGSATIVASAPNGRSAKLALTVADPLLPTKIAFSGYKSKLKVKKALKLKAVPQWVAVAPADKAVSVTWKSSNAKIAAVGKTTGKVIAKKAGKVKITATVTVSWNGRKVSKSASKTITVTR